MAGIRRTSLKNLDVPIPFRPPSSVGATTAAHAKWLKMLAEAEALVADDKFLQHMAAVRGMRLKDRTAPPEVIGMFYARYTTMVNNLYDAYMQNVHLQRADYIKEILNIFIKRLFELRSELQNILLTDYIYINEALIQNGQTPFDMDIVIPCLITKELRHDSLEDLLRQMWLSAMKRKKNPPTKKVPKVSNVFDTPRHSIESRRSDKDIEDPEDIFENEEEELPVVNPTYANTLLIQRMVRYSKFRLEANSFNFLKYMNPNKLLPSTRIEMAAAEYIKKVYRHFMFLKREHVKNYKRDVLMHFEHDPDRPKRLFHEETDKLYDLLNNIKKKLEPKLFEAFEKEKARLIFLKRDNIMEDITEHVRQWFHDWYYGYGKFPEFPTKLEKGTLLVVRGDFVTVEEQLANDEAYFKATKGKSPDQIKHEKQQEKKDMERKAEEAKVKEKSRANMLFKMRFSPLTDPGYMPCQSQLKDPLTKALRDYRLAWSFLDEMPEKTDTIFGYMKSLLTEEVLCTMHVECRAIVDELMREELKILIREQQKMYKRMGWNFPKIKTKTDTKTKQKIVTRSLAGMDDNIMKKLAPLFDVDGAITKPETKLKDVVGDYNYTAYDLLVKDPDAKFERPAYGDVKNRIHCSCVLGSGIQPGADRNKAVLLLGPEKSGKSFLVDAVAGEIHAVKINLTPEIHAAGDIHALELCTLALIAAKLFQPTVIYIRNIEKLFARKVPPEEVILKAKSYIGPLKKLLKAINVQDKIIFIATCSNPRVAKPKQMLPIFNDIILVPRADYGSIQLFLKEKFRKNIGIPYDHLTQPYANMLKKFGFGNVVRVYNEVMTSERILKLGFTPLSPVEFLEVIEREKLKPITDEEYKIYEDFFIKSTILHEKRIQFAEINDKRAKVYEGIRIKKLEQEKAKKSKPGSDGEEELPSE